MTITPLEARQVALAIVEIANHGYVPRPVPLNYQQALRDFCDGRVDRTSERISRLQRAVNSLTPVLNATNRPVLLTTRADVIFFSQTGLYSKLAPSLPVPKLHEKYEHKYVAKGGETIAEVAKKYGHLSASCVCHAVYDYPPNMRLQAGDIIFIPYNSAVLKQLANSYMAMRNSALEYFKKSKEKIHMEEKEISHWLVTVDIVAALAGGVAGLAEAGPSALKALAVFPKVGKTLGKEILPASTEIVKTMAEVTAICNDKTTDFKPHILSVGLRHLTGIVSPSWWASLYVAIKEREWAAWLYGPEGVAAKRLEELARHTEHYCTMLKSDLDFLQAQERSPIYTHKCGRCSG